MINPIIQMSRVVKRFYIGEPHELEILHGIDLTVDKSEFISIVGVSGSGKSTLMNIIGALDRATTGSYILDDTVIEQATDKELSAIRNRKVGFVFQNFNLIPRTNALKNVELPMMYAGVDGRRRRRRAQELLAQVGMEDRLNHLPNELSGGQKQRVAIARAMANNPAIILADEPTGSLDSKTGRLVMDLFLELNREQGKTVILITHNRELARETGRMLIMEDGLLFNDEGSAAG